MKHIFILMTLSLIASSCASLKELSSSTSRSNISPPSTLEEVSQNFVISEDALNTIPPEDIISETQFYPGGNGGGRGECSDDQLKEVEKMELIEINLCLPDPDQDIFVKIIKPNGSIVVKKVFWQSKFSKGLFLYEVPWDGQAGKYSFIFNGQGVDNIEYKILVTHPVGPQIYRIRGGAELYQFLPFEKIRIFVFTPFEELDATGRNFLGWATIVADKNGNATFGLEYEGDYGVEIAAVGEFSGQVLSESGWGSGDIYCEGAPNPQRNIDGSHVITIEDIVGYKDIDQYSSPVLIPEGSKLYISSHWYGVTCKDHVFWYFTYNYDGLWVPEGKDGEYFFKPAE